MKLTRWFLLAACMALAASTFHILNRIRETRERARADRIDVIRSMQETQDRIDKFRLRMERDHKQLLERIEALETETQ